MWKFHNFKIFPTLLHGYHTTSKYCYPSIAFSSYIFKILPTLYMEFFGIGNSTYYFLKIDSIYMSIIITSVSNITLLVLYNIIYFGYFMTMSHTINKNTSPSASLHLPFHYEVFTRFACCLLLYQPSTALIGFYFCVLFIYLLLSKYKSISHLHGFWFDLSSRIMVFIWEVISVTFMMILF